MQAPTNPQYSHPQQMQYPPQNIQQQPYTQPPSQPQQQLYSQPIQQPQQQQPQYNQYYGVPQPPPTEQQPSQFYYAQNPAPNQNIVTIPQTHTQNTQNTQLQGNSQTEYVTYVVEQAEVPQLQLQPSDTGYSTQNVATKANNKSEDSTTLIFLYLSLLIGFIMSIVCFACVSSGLSEMWIEIYYDDDLEESFGW